MYSNEIAVLSAVKRTLPLPPPLLLELLLEPLPPPPPPPPQEAIREAQKTSATALRRFQVIGLSLRRLRRDSSSYGVAV
jgi:hypothetical protein